MRLVVAIFAIVWSGLTATPDAALLAPEPAIEGTWTAQYAGGRGEPRDTSRIYLQFSRERSNMGQTWPASSLPGLALARDADDLRVELTRDAGTIVLTGSVRRGRGFGLFEFTPNPDFAKQVARPSTTLGDRAGKDLTPERLFALAVHDVGRAYIQQLEALGYKNLDLDDLLAMRIHRVTPEFITDMRTLGLGNLSHEDLIAFRIHGVTPAFVTAMRAAGLATLDHDELVAARIHGATPEFARELAALGYAGLDFDDLVAFRIHGVTPAFIREMAAAGYERLPADRLVEFRIHGVDAEFVKDLQQRGYTGLSARDLVDARIHGRRWMRRH